MLNFSMEIKNVDTREKLEKLYMIYYKEMIYTAYDILKDYHEAEDVVQESIIKLEPKLEKIKQIECNKTRAFLVIVVRNIALDIYRRRKRQKLVQIDGLAENLPQDNEMDFDLNLIRLDEAEKMARQLAKLDNSYADILTLRYFYEYSNSEIAKLINLSEGNVRVKVHRAQQALKKIILEEGSISKNEV
ncbi:RNA polymerase sigma factor [Clostridiaceae bacterium M8S5]|nr:RNA polymerase sigma factor [Clostridiaceae bacterium M8S5]